MENCIEELLKSGNKNCEDANKLAINTVANIEIPVCNTLSAISRHEFTQLLIHIPDMIQYNLKTDEKFFLYTLLMDVLTCIIKNKEFYTSYEKDCTQLIQMLMKKMALTLRDELRITVEECAIIQNDINLVKKYAKRITHHLPLSLETWEIMLSYNNKEWRKQKYKDNYIKKELKMINKTKDFTLDSNKNKISDKKKTENFSASLTKSTDILEVSKVEAKENEIKVIDKTKSKLNQTKLVISKSVEKNILVENFNKNAGNSKQLNTLKRNSTVILSVENNNEIVIKKSKTEEIKDDVIKKQKAVENSVNNKPKNAFDIMMKASKMLKKKF